MAPFARKKNTRTNRRGGELQGKLPGELLVPETNDRCRTDPPDGLLKVSLASFFTAPTMVIACPILMSTPKAGPLADKGSAGGGKEKQAGQEMTDFGGS
jgi:hypothetical protein